MPVATAPPHHHHMKKMSTDTTSHSGSSVGGDKYGDTEGDSGQEDHRRYSIDSQSSYASSIVDDPDFDPEDDEARKARRKEGMASVKNVRPFSEQDLRFMSSEEQKLVAPYLSKATATSAPNRAGSYLNRSTSISEGGVTSIDWAERNNEGHWSAAAGSSNQKHELRGQSHFGTGKGSFGVDSDREDGNGGSILFGGKMVVGDTIMSHCR